MNAESRSPIKLHRRCDVERGAEQKHHRRHHNACDRAGEQANPGAFQPRGAFE
jgi:hypothetical protein